MDGIVNAGLPNHEMRLEGQHVRIDSRQHVLGERAAPAARGATLVRSVRERLSRRYDTDSLENRDATLIHAFVTKVAPVRMVSMMMGVWYLANFIGNYMTGYLGTFYETMPKAQFFQLMTTIGIVAGIVLFVIGRPLDKIVSKHDKQQAH